MDHLQKLKVIEDAAGIRCCKQPSFSLRLVATLPHVAMGVVVGGGLRED